MPAAPPVVDEDEARVLAVCSKVLTRGRLTLVSPSVQAELDSLYPGAEAALNTAPWQSVVPSPAAAYHEVSCLDSIEESGLLHEVIPRLLGVTACRWIVPQVDISCLLRSGDRSIGGRVDFLFSHPRLSSPLVLEVDGEEHMSHRARDEARDSALRAEGYQVVRLRARDIRVSPSVVEKVLIDVVGELGELNPMFDPTDASATKVSAARVVHQIQLSLLMALKIGMLKVSERGRWHVTADLAGLPFKQSEWPRLLDIAVEDLVDLIDHLCELYQIGSTPASTPSGPAGQSIHISFGGTASGSNTFRINNIYVPFYIAQDSLQSAPRSLHQPSEELLKYFLHRVFRKDNFWEGQYEIVSRTLQGLDTIALLPTGGGKSIAFQLSSMLLPGRTIVIDPILSLIDDQIDNLCSYGIDRCIGITSQLDAIDRDQAMTHFGLGEYLFTYVAPERFQVASFRDSLVSLTAHTPVSLVTIDEAHCVSEWGHDFRTAYLNLGRIARQYCRHDGRIPPMVALTGTASKAVLRDVQRELQIEDFDAIVTPKSFDRPELNFQVVHCRSGEKAASLKGLLGQSLPSAFGVSTSLFYQNRGHDTFSGLVFCPHVNGDFGVVEVAEDVRNALGIRALYYSGGAPARHNRRMWDSEKGTIARRFKQNETPVLVATKAFGMGIDKPNIRYTVHYGLPASLESFYQEAGRAGRNRMPARCVLIVSNDDEARSRSYLDPRTSIEVIAQAVSELRHDDADDITRMLFFHVQAFRGISEELKDVLRTMDQLPAPSRTQTVRVVLRMFDKAVKDSDRARNRAAAEKSLHRLLLIGVVADYTVDYSSQEFTVRLSGFDKEAIIETYGHYVAGYSRPRSQRATAKAREYLHLPYKEFVGEVVRLLLQFIYEVIEQGRRAALREMVLATPQGQTDSGLRDRLLRYLEETEYSELLANMSTAADTGFGAVAQCIEHDVVSAKEAEELRGQVSRYLESYPDHPGYLILRGLSELHSRSYSVDVARQNFLAAYRFAYDRYGLSDDTILPTLVWALGVAHRRDSRLARDLANDLIEQPEGEQLARELIRQGPEELWSVPAWRLVGLLENRINQTFPAT